jgi:hypothetical protein
MKYRTHRRWTDLRDGISAWRVVVEGNHCRCNRCLMIYKQGEWRQLV